MLVNGVVSLYGGQSYSRNKYLFHVSLGFKVPNALRHIGIYCSGLRNRKDVRILGRIEIEIDRLEEPLLVGGAYEPMFAVVLG